MGSPMRISSVSYYRLMVSLWPRAKVMIYMAKPFLCRGPAQQSQLAAGFHAGCPHLSDINPKYPDFKQDVAAKLEMKVMDLLSGIKVHSHIYRNRHPNAQGQTCRAPDLDVRIALHQLHTHLFAKHVIARLATDRLSVSQDRDMFVQAGWKLLNCLTRFARLPSTEGGGGGGGGVR